MNAERSDACLAGVAAAIAEPSRARILCCLMDGHARTSTELAAVAEVSASTASAHLARLKEHRLIELVAQGKHRYYKLASSDVGAALEALMVVAGAPQPFTPSTPGRLRQARTCYDHMAGSLAVALNDHFMSQGWLAAVPGSRDYVLSDEGELALTALGIDVATVRTRRRRFACACLDWSERKPHLAGALGAALLQLCLQRGWVEQDLDSRALGITSKGRGQLAVRFGLREEDYCAIT